MIKITTISEACRALAEWKPEMFKCVEIAQEAVFYWSLNEILSTFNKTGLVRDLCTCDFDDILKSEGLEIEIARTFPPASQYGWIGVIRELTTANLRDEVGLFSTKQEASSAAFMAAVEYLVKQEKNDR